MLVYACAMSLSPQSSHSLLSMCEQINKYATILQVRMFDSCNCVHVIPIIIYGD